MTLNKLLCPVEVEVEAQRWPVSGTLGMGSRAKVSVLVITLSRGKESMERRCEQFVLETGRVLVQELDPLDPRCWTVQV
jgi:hypothetical protein